MYIFKIGEETREFENWGEAKAAVEAARSNGIKVEKVKEGPKTEEITKIEDGQSIIGKPGFLPDAAESADVVSEIPAQDTELVPEDTSSASRYVRFKGGQVVYEKDYLANNSGKGDYPESFDEYAEKFGGVPQDLNEVTTEGGELDAVLLSDMGPEFYVTKEETPDGQTVVNIDLDAIAKENDYEGFNKDLNKGGTEVKYTAPAKGSSRPTLKDVKVERTPQEIKIKRQLIRAYDEGANLLFEGTKFADSNDGSAIFFEDKINKKEFL